MDAEDAPSKHLSWKQTRTFTKLSPCARRVTNEMRKANKNGQRRKKSQVKSKPVGNFPAAKETAGYWARNHPRASGARCQAKNYCLQRLSAMSAAIGTRNSSCW